MLPKWYPLGFVPITVQAARDSFGEAAKSKITEQCWIFLCSWLWHGHSPFCLVLDKCFKIFFKVIISIYQHHTASCDLWNDLWLLQGWFGRKHANMFSNISTHVIVFVKTRKSCNHWLALKTKNKNKNLTAILSMLNCSTEKRKFNRNVGMVGNQKSPCLPLHIFVTAP